jgi:hypothetical protein
MGGEQRNFELSVPQIGGSALAAVTAAVAASYLGVAGTVIGAAVMSVGTTIGTAVYTHYLKRTGDKVKQRTVIVWRRDGEEPDGATEGEGRGEPATAVHATARDATPANAEDAGDAGDAGKDAPTLVMERPVPAGPSRGGLPWVKIAAVAALVFAISMGGILAYQGLTQATVHEQVTGQTPKKRSDPAPEREERRSEEPAARTGTAPAAPSATPTPTATRTATPTPAPTTSATPSATPSPTRDTAQPSAPATEAPTQDPGETGAPAVTEPAPQVSEPDADPEASTEADTDPLPR